MSAGKFILAGVVGEPISHSKSPVLHGHWLQKYGIKGQYVPLEVAQKDLETTLRTLPKMGFAGLNVTIPHKERALAIADHVSDRAVLIGAANTLIYRADGTIHADNTDGYGFIQNIKSAYPDWSAKDGPVALFGAGGAARAIIVALLNDGAEEIRISNRTRARAEALRAEFGAHLHVFDWVKAGNMLDGAATVVNTSALGMVGKPDLRVPLDALSKNALVTDIVYTPLQTNLLQHAQSIGCRTVDGLGMLLHQAVPGFERWFGQRPEVDDDLRRVVLES